MHPHLISSSGSVDAVIDPAATRGVLSEALGLLETRREALPRRKHTVGPL